MLQKSNPRNAVIRIYVDEKNASFGERTRFTTYPGQDDNQDGTGSDARGKRYGGRNAHTAHVDTRGERMRPSCLIMWVLFPNLMMQTSL